jgi:hypothetical protein
MKIRRQLRSVRASALSEDERRQELREAEARSDLALTHDGSSVPAASPRDAGDDGTSAPHEAGAERAGVTNATDAGPHAATPEHHV